jgi:hypothetical protein
VCYNKGGIQTILGLRVVPEEEYHMVRRETMRRRDITMMRPSNKEGENSDLLNEAFFDEECHTEVVYSLCSEIVPLFLFLVYFFLAFCQNSLVSDLRLGGLY